MKDRIRQLMEAQHMNQQTFASFTGIGTASLSSIFTGRTRPTLNHVDAIMDKFPNVNPMWLLKGIGGMMLSAGDAASGAGGGEAPTGESTTRDMPDATTAGGPAMGTAPMASASLSRNIRNGAGGASDNLSAPLNLFDAAAGSMTPRNGGSANGPSQAQSFRFDAQQKVIQIQRKITEIRVFYDDQTWESFVPKK